MDNPVLIVKQILDKAEYAWLDKVYANYLPGSAKTDTSETIALITSLREDPIMYGNNSFNGIDYGVQVQIFFKTKFTDSIAKINIQIMQLLLTNGWQTDDSKAIYTDPDTHQAIKVFYFTQNSFLRSEA